MNAKFGSDKSPALGMVPRRHAPAYTSAPSAAMPITARFNAWVEPDAVIINSVSNSGDHIQASQPRLRTRVPPSTKAIEPRRAENARTISVASGSRQKGPVFRAPPSLLLLAGEASMRRARVPSPCYD